MPRGGPKSVDHKRHDKLPWLVSITHFSDTNEQPGFNAFNAALPRHGRKTIFADCEG
jgi:hypothetical protein